MKNKIIYWIMGLLMLPQAFAASRYVPESLKNVLENIFSVLPEAARNGDVISIVYFKFFLWIVVFAIMFTALQKAFHGQRRVVAAIAVVMAAIGVIFIPNNVVLWILTAYSWLAVALLVLLPFLPIWYFRKKFPKGYNPCWVLLIAAIIIAFVSGMFIDMGEQGGANSDIHSMIGEWSAVLAVVLFILALICFLQKTGKGKDGGRDRDRGRDRDDSDPPPVPPPHEKDWQPRILEVDEGNRRMKGMVEER